MVGASPHRPHIGSLPPPGGGGPGLDPHQGRVRIAGANLHVYQTTFENDSRMLKVTRALIEHEVVDRCVVLTLWRPGLARREVIGPRRRLVRVRTWAHRLGSSYAARFVLFFEWFARILLTWARRDVGMVNCHSLATLPLGVLFKRIKGCRLVYDTHELESEAAGLQGWRQLLYRLLERRLIRHADEVIVVSESIARWYRATHHLPLERLHVVRNVPNWAAPAPRDAKTDVLRRWCGVREGELLFLYQGLLAPGRGIEVLLEVFADVSPRKHLVFMGYGALEPLVREHAARRPNIHFHPAVPPGELHEYTRSADVGLALIEPHCLSYEFCLPNKLYEYVMSGLPVVAADLTEMRRFVEKHCCGWAVDPSVAAVGELVRKLTPQSLAGPRRALHTLQGRLGWHAEQERLLEAYR